MLGYEPDELVGMHPSDWDQQEGDPERIAIRHAENDQSSIAFETRHRRKDGAVFDAEVSVQRVLIGGRRVFVTVSRDVSARIKAREDLRAREEIFRSIVSQAGDGIVLLDPTDGRFVEFNDAACEQLGYTRDEFAMLTLHQLQMDLSRDAVQSMLADVV